MSDYTFNDRERYAIYTVHGAKCYMCKKQIDLGSMHVDHIIPESLNEKELKEVKRLYGLGSNFDVNTPKNWMPSCPSCNLEKSAKVFDPVPILLNELNKASKKSAAVIDLIAETYSKQRISRAITILRVAIEGGYVTPQQLEGLQPIIETSLRLMRSRRPSGPKTVRLTPWLEVVSESGGYRVVKGPYGFAAQPKEAVGQDSLRCPACGSDAGFNGAICIFCGSMDDF